jgi:hypothetical protein
MSAVEQSAMNPVGLTNRIFVDIPTAAELAGFSIRHFRRIIEEDRIPIVQIGRKFFILGRDLNLWAESPGRSPWADAKTEPVQLDDEDDEL